MCGECVCALKSGIGGRVHTQRGQRATPEGLSSNFIMPRIELGSSSLVVSAFTG